MANDTHSESVLVSAMKTAGSVVGKIVAMATPHKVEEQQAPLKAAPKVSLKLQKKVDKVRIPRRIKKANKKAAQLAG